MSLEPSDRANQPFVVTPTAASANAAAIKRIEATRVDGVAARTVAIGNGVTGDAVFADEKPTGISESDDEDSASGEATDFAFCRLRGLYTRGRWAPVLALLG